MMCVRAACLLMFSFVLAGCSGPGSEAPVLLSGTLTWGARSDQTVDWELEEAAGYTYTVVFVTESQGTRRRTSVGRETPGDLVWLAGTIPRSDSPTIVFGGVANEIDSVYVFTAAGEQQALDIVPVADRDWNVATGEVPAKWATCGVFSVYVVASTEGSEVTREPLQSISG